MRLGPGKTFLSALALVAVTCAAGFGSDAGAATSSASTLPIPNAFLLHATNGYGIYVIGEPARMGSQGTVLVMVGKKGREVTYQAPGTVTETSIQASLGDAGEISVTFDRSGEAATVPCGKRKIRYDSGSWVGTIDFHGEEGFADAEATSAPGNIEYFLVPICGAWSTGGGPRKGADLEVRNPGLGPRLSVYKHRPGAAAVITAHLSEFVDGIAIERTVNEAVPGRDFSYDPRLRTAEVTPPTGLFSGTARFDAGMKAGHRWQGDLTVDMPGRADVPLTGPPLRATLSRSE